MTRIDEPLSLSAPLAWQMAPRLCRKDPVTGEDCSWNHGFWQILRLMGMITTPEHHREFFARACAAITCSESRPRILISGAADYSMLAHLLAAFRACGIAPAVTAVDLCETPLHLNRWYADRRPVALETKCCDILDYRAAQAFDAVCSHSFLGQFAPAQRTVLIERWRQLLRPGGTVFTVNRLRPAASSAWVGFSPEQQETFRETVLSKVGALRGIVDIAEHEIASYAEIYAKRQGAFPIHSREEVLDLFERGGLRLDHLVCAPVTAGPRDGVSGPTTPGGAEYACIIARRP
ncbi:MAG: class I SAM-dependent methyltransferase [Betaproteobacteria bacterium]|nr:class I SAM-dependent methyltransferase [Betaproteobacteria bacterium]